MKRTQDILVLVYRYNIQLTSTILLIRNVIIIILDIITVYDYNYKSNQCNLQVNKDFGAARSCPEADTTCICICSTVQMVWKFGFQKAVLRSKIVFPLFKKKKVFERISWRVTNSRSRYFFKHLLGIWYNVGYRDTEIEKQTWLDDLFMPAHTENIFINMTHYLQGKYHTFKSHFIPLV